MGSGRRCSGFDGNGPLFAVPSRPGLLAVAPSGPVRPPDLENIPEKLNPDEIRSWNFEK